MGARIAIDIDSTLHDYWTLFSRLAKLRFGVDIPYEAQRDWHIGVLRPEQVAAVVRESHSDENILSAAPYPGAVEAVARWSGEGHWIHITSHRADGCHDATERWLEQVGIPHDDLHCSYDKVTRCVELGIDLLIDDSPVNISRALEVGITPVTLRHPWNADVCEDEGVACAKDWDDLATVVDRLIAATESAGV